MELYAVKYGESVFRLKSIYLDMASSNELTSIFWMFYIVKYHGKILLFDTGFRSSYDAKKFDVNMFNIQSELKSIQINYDQVDTVFITHNHFDHIGNIDLYKNSTIIIAEAEFKNAIEQCPRYIRKTLERGYIIRVKDEYCYDGKFTFRVIGGHSIGSSVIYFSDSSDQYIITGDECYMSDNMLRKRPIGTFIDSQKNISFINDGYKRNLIPLTFHDPQLFKKYELVSENIVKII